MIKGLYSSASGMLPHVKKQEVIANNLANAGTTGFKKDIMFARELSRAESKVMPKKTDWQQTLSDRVHVDHAPGVFDKTNNPLDMAIEGDGFFVLEAADGSTALTRSGAFMVDSEGFISFAGGFRLIGDGGAIQVGSGEVVVSQTGEVESDGLSVGRIRPRTTADLEVLERLGGSVFGVPEGEELISAINANIRQGYLETSNVDVIGEMVDMIVAHRTYEANAKALQTQETSLDHLFHRVAGNQ
ncbi:MAG: hypothetical protein DRP45_09240 [Candidatus Zixiibacteriota bacterium]|nr:MAG: hypothetical protein DRP45_09240 [candidate division Zixibacteria bacterium]